jgi:hypothetical protein
VNCVEFDVKATECEVGLWLSARTINVTDRSCRMCLMETSTPSKPRQPGHALTIILHSLPCPVDYAKHSRSHNIPKTPCGTTRTTTRTGPLPAMIPMLRMALDWPRLLRVR